MALRGFALCALAVALANTIHCSTQPPPPTDAGIDSALDAFDSVAMPDAADVPGIDAPTDRNTTPPVQLGRHDVAIVDTRRIVPSDGLPPETVTQPSNNNLDVVRHSDGRVYLAWRTSANHFASPSTRMYVVSSSDEVNWRFEAQYAADTDLREPRLLSFNGTVFLYIARLGTDPLMFNPMGMSVTYKPAGGTWTPLTPMGMPDFIEWRTKIINGQPYMLGYTGGEHIYQFDGVPLDIYMLTTTDGLHWTPVNPARPVIETGGGSETDFVLSDNGSLFGITRNEAGDSTGWGSNVCHAPSNDITHWTCHNDPRKYDSPLMFWYDGEAYLIGRRNITPTGNFDLMHRWLPFTDQAIQYALDYSNRPKHCSLWRYDQATDTIVYVLDLPSHGDTCFPAIVAGDRPGDFAIYNYSSDINGPEVTWHEGQVGNTYIYRTLLRFTPRASADR